MKHIPGHQIRPAPNNYVQGKMESFLLQSDGRWVKYLPYIGILWAEWERDMSVSSPCLGDYSAQLS